MTINNYIFHKIHYIYESEVRIFRKAYKLAKHQGIKNILAHLILWKDRRINLFPTSQKVHQNIKRNMTHSVIIDQANQLKALVHNDQFFPTLLMVRENELELKQEIEDVLKRGTVQGEDRLRLSKHLHAINQQIHTLENLQLLK